MPKDSSPHHTSSTRKQNGTSGANQAPQDCPATVRPLLVRTALAGGVHFPVATKQRALRRMYGKVNRILYSAKISQSCKVVAAERTRQGAGVFSGGTKVRVTGRGNLMVTAYRAGCARGEINASAAPLTRWRDRNRAGQPVGTRSLNETSSGNNEGPYGWEA